MIKIIFSLLLVFTFSTSLLAQKKSSNGNNPIKTVGKAGAKIGKDVGKAGAKTGKSVGKTGAKVGKDIGKTGAIAQRIDITRPQKTGPGIDKGVGREPVEAGAMPARGRIPGESFFQVR